MKGLLFGVLVLVVVAAASSHSGAALRHKLKAARTAALQPEHELESETETETETEAESEEEERQSHHYHEYTSADVAAEQLRFKGAAAVDIAANIARVSHARSAVTSKVSRPLVLTVGGTVVPGVTVGDVLNFHVVLAHNAAAPVANAVPITLTVENPASTSIEWRQTPLAGPATAAAGPTAYTIVHSGAVPLVGAAAFNLPSLGVGIPATNDFQIRLSNNNEQGHVVRQISIFREVHPLQMCTSLRTNVGLGLAGMKAAAVAALDNTASAFTTAQACRMGPAIIYRNTHHANPACDATELEMLAESMRQSTAAAADNRAAFMFALEEELSRTKLLAGSSIFSDGHGPEEKDLLTKSALQVAAPFQPHFKLTIDHSGGNAIVECVVGPLPTGADGGTLAIFRDVINRFERVIPAAGQTSKYLDTAISEFNTDITTNVVVRAPYALIDPLAAKFQHGTIKNGAQVLTIEHITRDFANRPEHFNSVQVNMDIGLCGFTQNAFRALIEEDRVAQELWDAVVAAGAAYVTNRVSPAVGGAGELNALPTQQRCELNGLFAVYFYQLIGKSIHVELAVQRAQGLAANAVHDVHARGIAKNFYEMMIKTNVWHLVKQLPYPLSATVRTWYVAASGNEDTTHGHMIAEIQAALLALPNNGVFPRKYRGNSNHGSAYLKAATWAGHLVHFDGTRTVKPGPSTTQMGVGWDGGAIPAFRIRAAGGTGFHDEVALVVEARYQTSPFNIGFTEEHSTIHANPLNRVNINPTTKLNLLRAAQTSYQAGQEVVDWLAAC